MIGEMVTVTVDRPLGSRHPEHEDMVYPVNYGYIRGIMAPDGEEQDAYILGVKEAVEAFTGRVIAVICRQDDVEEKWVVAPEGVSFCKEEIARQVAFTEQFFRSEIMMEEKDMKDRMLQERFVFRDILPEEAGQAVEIEQICFPPNEACSETMMRERIKKAPGFFLVAVDKRTKRLAGFLNGIGTDETVFRDAFFTDAGLHDPDGKSVMLLGLDVLPGYRGQGLAREIMSRYLAREKERGRKQVILTCLEDKVKMYEKMGFTDLGLSGSSWGGEQWHEMRCELDR